MYTRLNTKKKLLFKKNHQKFGGFIFSSYLCSIINKLKQNIMSASSGAKTWKGQEVYNEIGSLWTKVSGKGGSAILLTATYNSCDGVKWMWRLEGMSGWFREGGYMSDTEQDAFNKGIEYCKENGYNIIKM